MLTERSKVRDFLAYALGYGPKLGFRVIPLRPGKKTPMLVDWPKKATWDETQIREWWGKWPDANIGILTGRYRDGYFCVLDFDPRNGGDWWDAMGEDILPATWVVHTPSGGRHFYYKTAELLRCAKLPDGVDLKADGGYVVAPPSDLLDKEGKPKGEWVWDVECTEKKGEMGDLPSGALAKLQSRGAQNGAGYGLSNGAGGGKSGGEADGGRHLWLMPPPIPKGMRHDYLVSLAGALWSSGLSKEEVEKVLWAALELLETLDDFEPEREISNIVKGLQKWEGETYTIGSLLRMLPERTAGVVRRVLTGGAVGGSAESNGVVAGQAEHTEATPQPQAESPTPTDAAAGPPQPDGDGGKAKSEVGKDRFQAARDIVRAFEMRQRGDGSIGATARMLAWRHAADAHRKALSHREASGARGYRGQPVASAHHRHLVPQ